MEELLKTLIEEQKKTNELLMYGYRGKDPNELLTIEQIVKEYDIGKVKVLKIFQDPELAVQKYTKPFKVTRKAFEQYFEVRHDDLCN